jgi:sec-independent protein translocase protein TatA
VGKTNSLVRDLSKERPPYWSVSVLLKEIAMIGSTELFLILVIVVVVFGAGKLPEVGGAIGRSLSEFRKASQNDNDQPKTPPGPAGS